MNPETSIVIRAFNEEKHLPRLLEAIRRQSHANFEIIVVDSGSLDRTREIAARQADQLLRLDSRDFTFGYALNMGIRAARGKFVAMVSAHTLPMNEHWLSALVSPLRQERFAMTYGRQLGVPQSKFGETQDLRRTFGTDRQILRPPHFFANNANSAVRRDLWDKHPFDETLPGLEDIAWAKHWMEKGYTVSYEPSAALYHIHEESWRQVRRRYYREAVAARTIGVKTRRTSIKEIGREFLLTFDDLAELLRAADRPSHRSRHLLSFLREILLFRWCKTVGTVQGLFDGRPARDLDTREKFYFDRLTRAVVIRGPGHAKLETLEIPEVKPGDALIRVAYAGVCATDLEILDGALGYYRNGLASYPIVPGHEVSGRIVAVGPNVAHLHEGDSVVVECIQGCGLCPECERSNFIGCRGRTEMGVIGRNGGYSEYLVIPGRFVHRLPPSLDLRTACLCEPLAVALKGLERLSRAWPREPAKKTCAVVGAGPLGQLCARLLHLQGHRVVVFERHPARRALLKDTGIETSTDHARIRECDTLLEVTGDPEILNLILERSAPGATLLLLGLPYGQRPFTFESIVAYDKTVVGSVGSGHADFAQAVETLPKLDLRAYLQSVYPLEQFQEAWEMARKREFLKTLLQIAPNGSPK